MADGLPRSKGPARDATRYNSPTIFNVTHSYKFNWTGKFESLEEQIDAPMQNPAVMNAKWDEIVTKLRQVAEYQGDFDRLYPREGITKRTITDAIVSYERSLSTPDARFDEYLRGKDDALTADEKAGWELFRTHGCVSCHQGVNLGGNMLERFGAVENYFEPTAEGPDLGRYNETKREEDRFVFRVPSLRNVALTAPYFHNGSAPTLEKAVDVMANYQLGRPLTSEQTRLLVGFLGTLTGHFEDKAL
jgi:cytochrome c peroxidase